MVKTIRRRGVTMVMALFVTFLLSALSLAFVTLMLEDSRGSRNSAWQIMASEGAEWGIETALSYMGRGGNWQPAFDPERLVFFDLLNPGQPNGAGHLTAVAGGSGTIQVFVEAGEGDDSGEHGEGSASNHARQPTHPRRHVTRRGTVRAGSP